MSAIKIIRKLVEGSDRIARIQRAGRGNLSVAGAAHKRPLGAHITARPTSQTTNERPCPDDADQ